MQRMRLVFHTPTRPSRTLSAVCREARKVVCDFLPDAIQCSYPDDKPDDFKDRNYNLGILLFNAASDIFVFLNSTSAYITRLFAGQHLEDRDPIRGIKHLGVNSRAFSHSGVFAAADGPCPDACDGPQCEIHCIRDNLPHFLHLFPDVTHLHIVNFSEKYQISRDGCFCGIAGSQEEPETIGPQKHAWPRIRAPVWKPRHYAVREWQWYVVRDADLSCRFPEPFDTECLGRLWTSQALGYYYPEFSHIQVKFVHPLPLWHPEGIDETFLGREGLYDGRVRVRCSNGLMNFIGRDDLRRQLKRENDGRGSTYAAIAACGRRVVLDLYRNSLETKHGTIHMIYEHVLHFPLLRTKGVVSD